MEIKRGISPYGINVIIPPVIKTISIDPESLEIIEEYVKEKGGTFSRAVCLHIQMGYKWRADPPDQALKALNNYREKLHETMAKVEELEARLNEKESL